MALTQAVLDQADQIRNSAAAQYSAIRSDGSRSVSGIQQGIAKIYLDAKTQMDALSAQTGTDTTTLQRKLMTAAFGVNVSGTPAEQAAASMSYRDAQDRVSDIDNPAIALDLMNRANDSNDDLLAKAIAQRAWDFRFFGGWSDVLDAYVAIRPQAAQAITALGEFATQNGAPDVQDLFAFVLATPTEVQGLALYRIAELAVAS